MFGHEGLLSTCLELFQPTHLKFALSLKGQMPVSEFARRKQHKKANNSRFKRLNDLYGCQHFNLKHFFRTFSIYSSFEFFNILCCKNVYIEIVVLPQNPLTGEQTLQNQDVSKSWKLHTSYLLRIYAIYDKL